SNLPSVLEQTTNWQPTKNVGAMCNVNTQKTLGISHPTVDTTWTTCEKNGRAAAWPAGTKMMKAGGAGACICDRSGWSSGGFRMPTFSRCHQRHRWRHTRQLRRRVAPFTTQGAGSPRGPRRRKQLVPHGPKSHYFEDGAARLAS
uniref:Uncharacterized protein n=1 Tax=Aegilops tauschii subsp. strangulata TaxID=200361 RepID=A0A452ZYT9_AEGTS